MALTKHVFPKFISPGGLGFNEINPLVSMSIRASSLKSYISGLFYLNFIHKLPNTNPKAATPNEIY